MNTSESRPQDLAALAPRAGAAPFPVGTIFMSGGKHPRRCVVRDILTTRNLAGQVVRIRYVAEHDFAGQVMRDPDVSPVAIARGFVSLPNAKVRDAGGQGPASRGA